MPTKYQPLADHLAALEGDVFAELEAILHCSLPPSARSYDAWWAFERTPQTHVQKIAWQGAGWRVAEVDRDAGTVRFVRLDDDA